MPSELAAERGEPSYVWRSGQERRLRMIANWVRLEGARVLEDGCGQGIYAREIRRRYTPHVEAIDIEAKRVALARRDVPDALVGAAEHLPYPGNAFDLVLSNEVIEHVQDDQVAAAEMVRVARPGGRIIVFCPNRWYPFETHGHYWRGTYHFGNTPLINYLPDWLRNRLAPHVRAYTGHQLRGLFENQPVHVVQHMRIFPGFDNIAYRHPTLGKLLRVILYTLESTPLRVFGLSHFLVLEKVPRPVYNPLPRVLSEQLHRIGPSNLGYGDYYPCRVILKDGRAIDRVYVIDQDRYIKAWGIYPEQDQGKKSIRIEDVARVEESQYRLPARLAGKIIESGMGYCIFTVYFRDGSHQAYITGNAVDFVEYPAGKSAGDVKSLNPHKGRDDPGLKHSPDYYWCLYAGVETD